MIRFFRLNQQGRFFVRLCFLAVLTLGIGTAEFVGYTQQPSQAPVRVGDSGGGVHGSVFVRVQDKPAASYPALRDGQMIALPDIEVFLQDLATGEPGQPVKTDLFGRFVFPRQKAGTYQLRWKPQAGWQEGVLGKNIVIRSGEAYPGSAEIQPQAGRGLLVGKVMRADGSSPWVYDEFFGVNRAADVTALDVSGNKVAEPVHSNVAGEFVIAGLPRAGLQLRAASEAAVVVQPVSASALSFGGPVSQVTLVLNQHRPQMLSVTVTVNQKAMRSVAPGTAVMVTADARSLDQDALTFKWQLQKGMGLLKPAGAAAEWTLPANPGHYSAYVLVSDGFGGYATGTVSIPVGLAEEAFANQSPAESVTSSSALGATPAGAPTACLTVLVGSSSLIGTRLTATTVAGTFSTQTPLNQRVVSVPNLPSNTDLVLGILGGGGQLTPNPDVTFETAPLSPLPDNVVHTGVAGDCQAVKLTEYPDPASGFLTQRTGSQTGAATYYTLVDPQGLRTGPGKTLGNWWQVNGFDQKGRAASEVRTSYLNNNDLGSGRDMHLLRHGNGTVSAYVTNYVDSTNGILRFNQNPTYADFAAAQNPNRRRAAVCMEWSPVEGATQAIVKFFVYNGGDASAGIIDSLDLVGNVTPKFVPELCLNCHGGNFDQQHADTQASFREFDLATFKYPGDRDVPNEAERAAFKQQNLIVRGSAGDAISAAGIKDLVNGWYGIDPVTYKDPFPSSTGQNTDWNPPGWDDPTAVLDANQSTKYLYHTVVAKSCRTCHVAFGDGIDWTSFAQFQGDKALIMFSSPSSYVFGTSRLMPHAPVTYKNFWNSRNPSEAAALQNFAGW